MNNFFSFKNRKIFSFLIVSLLMMTGGNAWGQTTYTKITSIGDLTDGNYVIANPAGTYAMTNDLNGQVNNAWGYVAVSPVSNKITNPDASIIWRIEINTQWDERTIYNAAKDIYVACTGTNNQGYSAPSVTGDQQRWDITYSSSLFEIRAVDQNSRYLKYNNNSGQTRFACYANNDINLQNVTLYKQDPPPPCSPAKVTLIDRGTTIDELEQEDCSDELNLPSLSALCDGWTFAGWKVGDADAADAPTITTSTYTPTSSVTLYAVYSKTTGGETNTIFSENMGPLSGSGTNSTLAANIWENGMGSGITFSGTADVRGTSSSSGYIGASGDGNVMINFPDEYFQIAGINTVGYSDLTLSFGLRKGVTANNGSTFVVQVSNDGAGWTTLTMPALPTGSGTATWYYQTCSGSIPSTSTLYIKFTTTTADEFRLDDVLLTGTSAITTEYSSAPSCASCATPPTLDDDVIDADETTLMGVIDDEGDCAVTEYGFVYNTTGSPTTADDKVISGDLDDGFFTMDITSLNLACGETYYFRSYAINTAGTGYSANEFDTLFLCPTFTVSFENEGIPYGSPQTVNQGDPITLPVVFPSVNSACDADGWVFAGWDTNPLTTSAPTIPESQLTWIPNGNVTLHAVYSKTTSGGASEFITIDITSAGGTSNLKTGTYDNGEERVWSQDDVDFGGQNITANPLNTPQTGSAAGQYIILRANSAGNGVIYNTSPLPGKIVGLTLNWATGATSYGVNMYGGTSRLVESSAQTINGGTQVGSTSTSGWTSTNFSGTNYKYFAINPSTASNNRIFSSIVIEYEGSTTEYSCAPLCVPPPTITVTPDDIVLPEINLVYDNCVNGSFVISGTSLEDDDPVVVELADLSDVGYFEITGTDKDPYMDFLDDSEIWFEAQYLPLTVYFTYCTFSTTITPDEALFGITCAAGNGELQEYVTVSGTAISDCSAAPAADYASSITENSFKANWYGDADDYNLYVYTKEISTPTEEILAKWTFPYTTSNSGVHIPYYDIDAVAKNRAVEQASVNNTGLELISTAEGSYTVSQGYNAESAGSYSISINQWANGADSKCWLIENLNTTAFSSITISSAQHSSNAGPKNFKLQYQIGVLNWVDVPNGNIEVGYSTNNWTGTITDLPLPNECANQPDISIRWIMTSNDRADGNNTVETTGTSRIDNIFIKGMTSSEIQIPVPGYNPKLVENALSQSVTGLTSGETYYYVVEAIGSGACFKLISEKSDEIEVTLSSSSDIESPQIVRTIYTVGNTLIVNALAGETIEIYNVLGQPLTRLTAQDGETRITVPSGVLLVRIAGVTAKVVVK